MVLKPESKQASLIGYLVRYLTFGANSYMEPSVRVSTSPCIYGIFGPGTVIFISYNYNFSLLIRNFFLRSRRHRTPIRRLLYSRSTPLQPGVLEVRAIVDSVPKINEVDGGDRLPPMDKYGLGMEWGGVEFSGVKWSRLERNGVGWSGLDWSGVE